MVIMLGNLSLKDIENRLQIKLTDEEWDTLNPLRIVNCEDVHNHHGWHCYDMPFAIACGDKEMLELMMKILSPYSDSMQDQIQVFIDYDTQTEVTKC